MKRGSGTVRTTTRSADGVHEVVSPVTGRAIDHVHLAPRAEILAMLENQGKHPLSIPDHEVFAFLDRLCEQLLQNQDMLREKTILETGFIARDSAEIIEAAIVFLRDFETYAQEHLSQRQTIRHSYSSTVDRDMRIIQRPARCVAAVVPQNASLTLGIIIIASALYSGSRVILRPSLQTASTGAVLADLVARSKPPQSSVLVVNSLASDFLDACLASEGVDLIHYIGSNQYALEVFQRSFGAGKVCLLDGQGNGLLYVDDTCSLETAVRIVTDGATRYNGETCTSINGVLAHPDVYEPLKAALIASFSKLRVGDPLDPRTEIGPLFSRAHAETLRCTLQKAASGRLLCGASGQDAFFTPAIIEGLSPTDPIVRRGFFGPAIWLGPAPPCDLWMWLRNNQFPLSDTILSTRRDLVATFARNSRAGRICVNQDPSVESMFEPWGGYPPSGLNPVSVWIEKYRQTFQLDGTLREIIAVEADLET